MHRHAKKKFGGRRTSANKNWSAKGLDSIGAEMHHTKRSPDIHRCIYAPHAHATPFLASLSLPALPRPRFGVNGLGMSRAIILESGVVIRCESFELQPFKFDQLFHGVFKRSSNRNTYRNEAFKDTFS